MTTKVELNSIVYNTLISAYCINGNMIGALGLFHDMKNKGIRPTYAPYSSLLHRLCNIGNVEAAKELIDEMRRNDAVPNVVCYTEVIRGFVR